MGESSERKNFKDGYMWTYFVKMNGTWTVDFHATNDIEMSNYEDMLIEKSKTGTIDDWLGFQRPLICSTEQQEWEKNICKIFNDSTSVYYDSIFDDFDDDMVWW